MMFEFEKGQWKQIDSDIQRELNNFSKKTGSEKPIKNRFDMTIQEQAESLIEKYNPHVNPYIGSGMLTNTYDDTAIRWQSIKCTILEVKSKIDLLEEINSDLVFYDIQTPYYLQKLNQQKEILKYLEEL